MPFRFLIFELSERLLLKHIESFHPEMVFLTNLGVSLCIGCAPTCRSPPRKGMISLILSKPGPAVKRVKKIFISGLETGFYREIISGWNLENFCRIRAGYPSF